MEKKCWLLKKAYRCFIWVIHSKYRGIIFEMSNILAYIVESGNRQVY
jgi:hypothetical protein